MNICHIVIFRRLSVQDESTGSILSPSDISYDNTEDDLVGFANRSIHSVLVLQILCYNGHPNNKLDINPLQKINNNNNKKELLDINKSPLLWTFAVKDMNSWS